MAMRNEERGEKRGAQHTLGQVWRLILLSEVFPGSGACDGKQFSEVIVSPELEPDCLSMIPVCLISCVTWADFFSTLCLSFHICERGW